MADLRRWMCEYNGLTMGADNSAVQISEVDGLLSLPDISSSDLELVQRHGLWSGDDYMGGRTITLTLEVFGESSADFTRAITNIQAAFLPGDPEKQFKFWFPGLAADRPAYVMVRPRKRSGALGADFAANKCKLVVELGATDPSIYGLTPRSLTVSSSKREHVDGGLTIPLRVPFTIKGAGALPADPVLRWTQWGAIAALPVIRFVDAERPTLHDDVTREYFGVSYSGSFDVDSAARTVTTLDGGDITGAVVAGSVWPEYGAGDHRLRLVHGDPYTAATATLTYTETWV